MIKLIVGLGNPGDQYEGTRHNFGQAFVAGLVLDQAIHLLLPDTYMNLSGQPVAKYVRFHKLEPEEVLVVHDELDLPLGRLEWKLGGSAAGHNGVASIVDTLGTDQFWRLRLGIGRPGDERDPEVVSRYVLSRFTPDEQAHVARIIDEGKKLLLEWLQHEPVVKSINSLSES